MDRDYLLPGVNILCLHWNATITGGGAWDPAGCVALSLDAQTYPGQLGSEPVLGVGTVLCACEWRSTTIAAFFDLSQSISVSAASIALAKDKVVLHVWWGPETPADGDELVVLAGDTLQLKVTSISETPFPSATLLLSRKAPCTLQLWAAGAVMVAPGSTSAGGTTLAAPSVQESAVAANGPFWQRTVWELSLPPTWTLATPPSSSGSSRDTVLKALLVEDSSWGRERHWTVRVLDCDVLAVKGDSLQELAIRFGPSQRLLFAMIPLLAALGVLPDPLGSSGVAAVAAVGGLGGTRWACGGASGGLWAAGWVPEVGREAGGVRVQIGRKIQIAVNKSIVDQVG
jgi:hypothetical protein